MGFEVEVVHDITRGVKASRVGFEDKIEHRNLSSIYR